MWCEKCGEKTKVKAVIIGETNKRWRVCPHCNFSFETEEIKIEKESDKESCNKKY